MARDPSFPRSRHVALSEEDGAAGSEALLAPLATLEEPAVPALAPGETPPGELPPTSSAPGLAAGASLQARAALEPGKARPARVAVVDLAHTARSEDRCATAAGAPIGLRCASSLSGRASAAAEAARAASLGDAVLLDGLDAWYGAGPLGAGFCSACGQSLVETLRERYGEHLQPFDVLDGLRGGSLAPEERPFARERETLRFATAVEQAKRTALRARDEARRGRGREIAVLGRVRALSPLGLALSRHLDGLIFDLPSTDALESLLPILAARAALGQRPAVAALPASATPGQVRQLAALAAACDADVLLPAGASGAATEALGAHRRFLAQVRERYRPPEPLVDAEILLSPRCDHLSGGAHGRTASAAAVALAQLQASPAVRLDLAGGTRSGLLVLPSSSGLPAADGAAARRHVEGGGDALVLGRAVIADEDGREVEPVFPAQKPGMERLGEGRVFFVDEPRARDLPTLGRAIRELLGSKGLQISVAGRGKLWSRAYLDADRKLDVHLVNLDLRDGEIAPAQGMQITIAGAAAGGGRTGYWFAPERQGGKDGERIALNPSGFSVSTILPSIGPYALLAVPR